ncbi:MAG: hypothetical protein JO316_02680 [Abitibacteriaceae bacterium]|nr:hypothetical protein [Abditibacteriaceae bacterium]
MRNSVSRIVVVATLATIGSSLLSSQVKAQPAKRPGLMNRLLHRNSGTTGTSSTGRMGGVVGNKKTHVFHLPGDRGKLPEPQNRVYFRTAAEARAAGYHEAGATNPKSRGAKMGATHGLFHRPAHATH